MYADADEYPDHEGSLSVLWQMLALLGVLMVVVPGAVALSHFSPFSPLSPYSPLSSISGLSGSGGVNNGEEMRVGGNDGVSSAPAVAIDPSGLGRTASSPSISVSTSPRSSFTNTNRFRNRSVRALTSNHVTRAGASTPDPNPLGFLVLATGLFAGTSLFQTCQRALAKIRSGDTHALHGQCPNCGEDVWQFLDSPGAGAETGERNFVRRSSACHVCDQPLEFRAFVAPRDRYLVEDAEGLPIDAKKKNGRWVYGRVYAKPRPRDLNPNNNTNNNTSSTTSSSTKRGSE